jgi:hypothetical protein
MKIDKNTSQKAADLVRLEHELFFKYLRVSPSYQLAHSIQVGDKTKSSVKGLIHFNEVMKTYEIVGDVFNTNFVAWWETKGHLLFEGKEFVNLSFRLNLTKDKNQEIKRIRALIDSSYHANALQESKLRIETNKIRYQTLEDRMRLLEEKAYDSLFDGPKRPGWMLLDLAEVINTKHSLRYRVKKTTTNTYERSYLTMLASRHFKEVLVLAENAALGKFPSFKKNPSKLKFDLWRVGHLEGIEARINYAPYTSKQYSDAPTQKKLTLLQVERGEKSSIKKEVKRVRSPIVKFYKEYKQRWNLK